MATNLNGLRDEVYASARSRGFYDKKEAFGTWLSLMHGELSEAMEEDRKGRKPTEVYFNPGSTKPEGIPIELADALVCILNYCGEEGIDIENAVKLKNSYNKTRPYKHGGKKY